MVQLIIPNAYQVAIEMSVSGQQIINVIGVGGNFGTSTAEGVAGAVKAGWEAAGGILKGLSSSVVMVGYTVTDLSSSDGQVFHLASTAQGGNTGSTMSTLAAAALIQYGNGTRNRSSRGRMYVGPLSENDVNPDGRTLATVSITKWTTAINVLVASIQSIGCTFAVLSRVQKSYNVISSVNVASVVATQRRRLR